MHSSSHIRIYTHTSLHPYNSIHTQAHTHSNTCTIHSCSHIRIYTHTSLHPYNSIHTQAHTHTNTCTVHSCSHIRIYTHTQAHTYTNTRGNSSTHAPLGQGAYAHLVQNTPDTRAILTQTHGQPHRYSRTYWANNLTHTHTNVPTWANIAHLQAWHPRIHSGVQRHIWASTHMHTPAHTPIQTHPSEQPYSCSHKHIGKKSEPLQANLCQVSSDNWERRESSETWRRCIFVVSFLYPESCHLHRKFGTFRYVLTSEAPQKWGRQSDSYTIRSGQEGISWEKSLSHSHLDPPTPPEQKCSTRMQGLKLPFLRIVQRRDPEWGRIWSEGGWHHTDAWGREGRLSPPLQKQHSSWSINFKWQFRTVWQSQWKLS